MTKELSAKNRVTGNSQAQFREKSGVKFPSTYSTGNLLTPPPLKKTNNDEKETPKAVLRITVHKFTTFFL